MRTSVKTVAEVGREYRIRSRLGAYHFDYRRWLRFLSVREVQQTKIQNREFVARRKSGGGIFRVGGYFAAGVHSVGADGPSSCGWIGDWVGRYSKRRSGRTPGVLSKALIGFFGQVQASPKR